MKHSFRTVTWRFQECQNKYAGLTAEKVTISGPSDIVKHFRPLFQHQVRERFVVFWLDSANSVTGFEIVTEGILNSSLVHPREVFRGAIVASCASIIIAHNHPSGNDAPSTEDIRITRQLREAGQIIGIPLHDHIIFTDETYKSFAQDGLI